MPTELIADVALRATLGTATRAVLTYRVPPRLRGVVRPGQLVWAPLRRKRVQGVVLGLAPARDHDAGLRELDDLGDPEARLTPAGLVLAEWVAATYRAPLYEALALLLPPGTSQVAETTWRATEAGLNADLGALPEAERAVLYYLRTRGEQGERALRSVLRGSDPELRAIYAALAERGFAARGLAQTAPAARPRRVRLARLAFPFAELPQALATLARAPKQRAVVAWLAERLEWGMPGDLERGSGGDASRESEALGLDGGELAGAVLLAEVYEATGADATTVRVLEQRGLLAIEQREVRRDPLAGDGIPPDQPPALTQGQRAAYEAIVAAIEAAARPGGNPAAGHAQPGTHAAGHAQPGTHAAGQPQPDSPAERQGQPGTHAAGQPQTRGTLCPSAPLPHSPSSPRPLAPVFLLHGITGSGKTEVYLRTIARAMRLGRQALVLVPEIALTAQLVRRFAARFPGKLAVLHSGLSLGERYDEWRRLRRGEARLAIGSRSAVFAPLSELGLIIVDEEHELTYKHDGSPRYHARDTALHLAELTGSVVILGSATPSVESYARAARGEYRLLELTERVGGSIGVDGLPRSTPLPLPPVRLVDMRRELAAGNRSIFSRQLQQALDATLARGEQSILFLNRRGAAAFVMCRDCGHVINCGACSGPMTVHYDEDDRRPTTDDRREPQPAARSPQPSAFSPQPSLLICHSCGSRAPLPYVCPQCMSPRVRTFGVGTQRVAEAVAELLPGVRVLRWDRDTVGGKGAHGRMLDALLRHEVDVLVGTQMIAKGLDLPLVSLVGVVAADTGLQLPDFRSGERAFQLLTQVAGRAGRRTAGAQVIIQSYNPEHYALQAAQEHDYQAFFTQEIAYRRETGYPPFSRLVRFVYAGPGEATARREAEHLAEKLAALLAARRLEGWGLVGPAPAFIQRARGRWRWHLILRVPAHAPPAAPGELLDALGHLHGWIVDVDPAHVL